MRVWWQQIRTDSESRKCLCWGNLTPMKGRSLGWVGEFRNNCNQEVCWMFPDWPVRQWKVRGKLKPSTWGATRHCFMHSEKQDRPEAEAQWEALCAALLAQTTPLSWLPSGSPFSYKGQGKSIRKPRAWLQSNLSLAALLNGASGNQWGFQVHKWTTETSTLNPFANWSRLAFILSNRRSGKGGNSLSVYVPFTLVKK